MRSWDYIIDQVKLFQNLMKDEAEAQLPLPPVISYAMALCEPIQDGALSVSRMINYPHCALVCAKFSSHDPINIKC